MPPQSFNPESFNTFGDLLKYLRRRERLTQLEFSIAVGYSEGQISRLEQNQRLPDLTALKALFIPALHIEDEPETTARFIELAQSARQEDAPAPGVAPYKGLLFFNESDSELFFGREKLTARLADRVTDLTMQMPLRFLAVVGASGSGKSSLVRAGLAVTLKRVGWSVYTFTPGTNPFKTLEVQFELNQAKAESKRVLILVDQFEETFTLCRSETERVAFIERLLEIAQDISRKTMVVIALRADFYSHCAQYPLLRQAVAAEQEYIGQMTAEELRSAIEEPARHGGWEFEPGLVDVLLNDIGADGMGQPEPGALPLLSHALLATWERRRRQTFTLDGYHASGGVRSAIAETAESVFTDQLNLKQQELAHDVFLRLTELGEGTEDTRRRASLNELVRQTDEATQVRAVLNTLAEARLITLNEDTAEVAHEALIREWQRLHEWLTQDREGLHLHRHLTESTREWETMGRDPSELYRGARLAQTREWIVTNEERLNESERAFLTASIEHEEHDVLEREAQHQRELEAAQKLAETKTQSELRLRGRNRVISTVGVIALLLAMLAGIFGLQSNQNAEVAEQQRIIALNAQAASQTEAEARATQQAIAEANFRQAEAQRLAAETINLQNSNGSAETVALLALRSLNLEYSPQGDAALLSAINLNYPLQVFTGNTDVVNQIAFSPDDKMILTGCIDNTARLFDIETGQQLQVFSGHTAQLNDITFSSDGKWVLTGGQDQTARLWDTATGLELQTFIGHTNFVITVAFTADGKQIMTGSEDGTMRLWDIETGHELKQWDIKDPVSAFSPDGNYAVGYSEIDNADHLWDTKTLTVTHSFTRPTPPNRYPILFSADGKYLLAGFSGDIVLFDVASGKELQVFKGNTDSRTKLAFSPDSKYVLSAFDGTASLWDVQTGQEVHRFSGEVVSAAFSSDGKRILTGSLDGTVRLWNVEPRPELPIFNGQKGGMVSVAFSPDGKYLATNVLKNELQLWDVTSGQTLWSAKGSGLALWALKYSPDGKYLLSGNMDGVTTLWDAETGEEVRQFTAEGLDEINAVAFSPDGKTIAAGGFSQKSNETFAPMWDVETGREIRRFPLPGLIYRLSFSPDGKSVLTGGGGDYEVSILWDIQSGIKLREFAGNEAVFSADGKYIVTSKDATGFIWNAETGEEIRRFVGPTSGIGFTTFSPDGKFVAAASWNGVVRLWDSQTGQELRRYPFPGGAFLVVFSPDSKYLVSVGGDGTARFFDVDYHTTTQYLCSILLRDLTDAERAQYGITDTTPTCPKP